MSTKKIPLKKNKKNTIPTPKDCENMYSSKEPVERCHYRRSKNVKFDMKPGFDPYNLMY